MTENDRFNEVLLEWVKVFVHRSMREFSHWMNDCGLSRSQIGALMEVFHKEQCPVTEIGKDLGITTPAASQLVDRLVNMELMERKEDPEDRRAKIVTLSKDGRTLIRQGMSARVDWMEDLSEVLSEAQIIEITQSLDHLIAAANEIDIQPDLEIMKEVRR